MDFLDTDPLVAPALSQRFAEAAADEAIAQSGIGRPGDFPGALFIAVVLAFPNGLAGIYRTYVEPRLTRRVKALEPAPAVALPHAAE